MKKLSIMLAMLLVAGMASAKDMHVLVVKVSPNMTCAKCEAKVKQNVRFAKGVKTITTDLKKQTVTIQYDAEKGKAEAILKEFRKIGYTPTVVSDNKGE